MVQVYNITITLTDGITQYNKFVHMTDEQFQALQTYLNICVANGYGCTAATVTLQENPISYGAFCENIINGYSIAGPNCTPLPDFGTI